MDFYDGINFICAWTFPFYTAFVLAYYWRTAPDSF